MSEEIFLIPGLAFETGHIFFILDYISGNLDEFIEITQIYNGRIKQYVSNKKIIDKIGAVHRRAEILEAQLEKVERLPNLYTIHIHGPNKELLYFHIEYHETLELLSLNKKLKLYKPLAKKFNFFFNLIEKRLRKFFNINQLKILNINGSNSRFIKKLIPEKILKIDKCDGLLQVNSLGNLVTVNKNIKVRGIPLIPKHIILKGTLID